MYEGDQRHAELKAMASHGCARVHRGIQAQGMRRRPRQALVSCSGGRTTACDPHTFGGDPCGEQRGPGLKHHNNRLRQVGDPFCVMSRVARRRRERRNTIPQNDLYLAYRSVMKHTCHPPLACRALSGWCNLRPDGMRVSWALSTRHRRQGGTRTALAVHTYVRQREILNFRMTSLVRDLWVRPYRPGPFCGRWDFPAPLFSYS